MGRKVHKSESFVCLFVINFLLQRQKYGQKEIFHLLVNSPSVSNKQRLSQVETRSLEIQSRCPK